MSAGTDAGPAGARESGRGARGSGGSRGGGGARANGRAHALLGYAVAAACLVWVFHDLDLRAVGRSAAHVRWAWMLPAILLDVASYVCQGWRWRLLLPITANLSVVRTTQAIYAGLFVSEVTPARLGELVRGYLVQRWGAVPPAQLVGSMLIERFFDGVWLALGIIAVAITVPLPRRLVEAEDLLGGVLLVAAALLLFLVLRARHRRILADRVPLVGDEADDALNAERNSAVRVGQTGLRAWAHSWALRLGRALAESGSSQRSLASAMVSVLVPLLEGLALWLVMVGYGLPLSVWSGIAVLLIVRLGTAIPNAPGNLGTYQALCVLGLRLFHVEKATAAGFSIVAFVVLTLPLWGLGLLALGRTGTSLATLRDELQGITARARQPTVRE